MIFMPPRNGKSELVTKHFAAYWLKNNPSKNIILGSYNQQLANKFSRGIRGVMAEDALRKKMADEGKACGSAAMHCGKAVPFRDAAIHISEAVPPPCFENGGGAPHCCQ